MVRLGIDFGTTNTVAVLHDRGMFNVVHHGVQTGAGQIVQEVFPSAILIDRSSNERWYGIEADRRFAQLGHRENLLFIPSLKRKLRDYSIGRTISGVSGNGNDAQFELAGLMTSYLQALNDSIRRSQDLDEEEPMEAVITWPANANGAQRYITRQCFRNAGFTVLDTLNEPTASAIELADCLTAGKRGRNNGQGRAVAVFDMGGGTFDASVVWIEGDDFTVLTSSGIENLGGDDFDQTLLDMFLEKLDIEEESLQPLTLQALLRQARSQKELIAGGMVRGLFVNPIDFGLDATPVSIPIEAYYEKVKPLAQPAVATLQRVIAAAAEKEPRVKPGKDLSIYLVGGSSRLPLVGELVSQAYKTSRVILTDKPYTSVAMGAAIGATERVRYRDVFARHFGLIRLRDHGRLETFDIVFPAGTPIPRKGEPPLETVTRYQPQHNIGHLRYLECTEVDTTGMPTGNLRQWSDIVFPYDPSEPLAKNAVPSEIVATDAFADQIVCEVYRCDHDGVITVELQRPATEERRTYEIFSD